MPGGPGGVKLGPGAFALLKSNLNGPDAGSPGLDAGRVVTVEVTRMLCVQSPFSAGRDSADGRSESRHGLGRFGRWMSSCA
jgi:hypothetical protein